MFFDTKAELEQLEECLEFTAAEYTRHSAEYRSKEAELPWKISVAIERIKLNYRDQLRRAFGKKSPTQEQAAHFMAQNQRRIKRDINSAIAAVKKQSKRELGKKPDYLPMNLISDSIRNAKEDLIAMRELLGELLFQNLDDLTVPFESVNLNDPNVTHLYRGTNLSKFVIAPESIDSSDKSMKIVDFEKGVDGGRQFFSGFEMSSIGLTYALYPSSMHGMATLRDNHPWAVVLLLEIPKNQIPSLLQSEDMAFAGRQTEIAFSDSFLTGQARFKLIKPHELE